MKINDFESYDKNEISKILKFLQKTISVGNSLSIKSGLYPCAKHYQKELKDWADIVSEYNSIEESK